MEEEIREQPQQNPANVSNETSGDCAESDAGSLTSVQEEPKYGKFQNLEELLKAYNNLEAEFTKKCQRLSVLEKEKTEETESLNQGFDEFLSQNDEAKEFSEEIKNYVQSDLNRSRNPFETAWAKVVIQHLSDSKQLDDPIVNRYVLNNDTIKTKIVENYLHALSEQKTPITISSHKGERVSGVVSDTPKTLNEARKLVEKMFS